MYNADPENYRKNLLSRIIKEEALIKATKLFTITLCRRIKIANKQ